MSVERLSPNPSTYRHNFPPRFHPFPQFTYTYIFFTSLQVISVSLNVYPLQVTLDSIISGKSLFRQTKQIKFFRSSHINYSSSFNIFIAFCLVNLLYFSYQPSSAHSVTLILWVLFEMTTSLLSGTRCLCLCHPHLSPFFFLEVSSLRVNPILASYNISMSLPPLYLYRDLTSMTEGVL